MEAAWPNSKPTSAGIPNALTLAFGIHFFLTRKRPLLVFGLFLYLLITSFYSYFSSWREPLVLVLICYFVSLKKFKIRELTRLRPDPHSRIGARARLASREG